MKAAAINSQVVYMFSIYLRFAALSMVRVVQRCGMLNATDGFEYNFTSVLVVEDYKLDVQGDDDESDQNCDWNSASESNVPLTASKTDCLTLIDSSIPLSTTFDMFRH